MTSVFRFTSTHQDNDDHGARIPAFFVKKSSAFLLRTSLGNNQNFGITFNYVIGETYHVVIQQYKYESKYWFKVIVNDEVKEDIENEKPQSFSNVRFYTSDEFWPSFSYKYGIVCNFKIQQYGGEFSM